MINFPDGIRQALEAACLSRRGVTNSKDVIRFCCPAHDDAHPSADFDSAKGVWICRTCGAGGGWMDLATRLGIDLPKKHKLTEAVTESQVIELHGNLLASPDALHFLAAKRRITREVVMRFRLGLATTGDDGRHTFYYPILLPSGEWFGSARIYRPFVPRTKNGPPRRFWAPKFSQLPAPRPDAPIFGLVEHLEAAPAVTVVTEGEDKALGLWGIGIPACAITAGVGTWKKSWRPCFKGKDCVYVADVDPAGLAALPKIIAWFGLAGAASLKIVKLPLAGTAEAKDVTDWLLAGGTREQFDRLIDAAPPEAIKDRSATLADKSGQERPPADASGHGSDDESGVVSLEAAKLRSGLTDWGNAQRLVRLHGDDIRYCYDWAKWLVWDGKRWNMNAFDAIQRFAKNVALDLYEEAADTLATADEVQNPEVKKRLVDKALRIKKWAEQSESASRLKAMLDVATSELGIRIRPSEMDAKPWLLNVQNGTLDLKTKELRGHARGDYLTRLCTVAFNPAATAPRFEKFLSEIMGGNAGLVGYIQRIGGYSLTAVVRQQVLFFFYGTGANGKSTFLEVLLHILGTDYAQQAAPEILAAKDRQNHPTEIADFFGLRFVSTVEVSEGRRLAETLVKQLTGNDTLKARRMREDFWSFRPTHKLVLAANHKPNVRGADYAIWRRIRIVPFEVTFTPDKQDPNLLDALKREAEGILAFFVRGCGDWDEHGLNDPPEVLQATDAYQKEMDDVGRFIEDRCTFAAGLCAASGALHGAYQAWHASEVGGEPLSPQLFARRLEGRGLGKKRTRDGAFWHGIGLNASPEPGREPGDEGDL